VIGLFSSDLLAARAFQWLLWIALCMFALRRKQWALPLSVLLLSPQIWYLYAYFNSDAFPLFLAMVAAMLLCDRDGGVHACLEGRRRPGSAILAFALCLGLLLVAKSNYVVLVPGMLLWIAVLHLDLRWRELLAALFGLGLLGAAVFLDGVPAFVAWHLRTVALVFGLALFVGAASSLLLRCRRDVLLRRPTFRLIGLCIVITAIATPRFVQDVWVNGTPAVKAAQIAMVEEAHAGQAYKPSVVAQGNGAWGTALAASGIGLSQMLFDAPYRWCATNMISAFGVYGYMNIYAPNFVYVALATLALLIAILSAIALVRAYPGAAGRLLVTASGVCALVALSSILHSWIDAFQPQGRYLLPMAAMLALVMGHAAGKLPIRVFKLLLLASLMLSGYSFARIALPAFTHVG
jgi:hypothetical protein